MKRFLATTLIALAVLAFGGLALAQATAPFDLEGAIATWFLELSVLGGVVATIVAFARKRIIALDGLAVNALAVGVGAFITIAGKLLGIHAMAWIPAVLYGVGAGLWATGLVELGRSIAGKRLGG